MRKAVALEALTIGCVAAQVLEGGGRTEVLAVYERSAYLLTEHGIVAVGMPEIGNGPLNVIVPRREGIADTTPLGLLAGMKGVAGGGRIAIGSDVVIGLTSAEIWQPAPWPDAPGADKDALARGLDVLQRGATALLPVDGVAALVFAPQSKAAKTRSAVAAAPLVAALGSSVAKARATGRWSDEAIRAATLLVGLGPGLTPSGDDLLGGLMLALSASGGVALRDALWDAIAPELDDLTVPISAMHLSAAANGFGADAMHHLIDAVLRGDAAAIAMRLPVVAALGATSGMDAVAGLCLGFGRAGSVG